MIGSSMSNNALFQIYLSMVSFLSFGVLGQEFPLLSKGAFEVITSFPTT